MLSTEAWKSSLMTTTLQSHRFTKRRQVVQRKRLTSLRGIEVLSKDDDVALLVVEQRLSDVPCSEVEILSNDDDLFGVEPAYQGLQLEQDLVQRPRAQTQYLVDGPF